MLKEEKETFEQIYLHKKLIKFPYCTVSAINYVSSASLHKAQKLDRGIFYTQVIHTFSMDFTNILDIILVWKNY